MKTKTNFNYNKKLITEKKYLLIFFLLLPLFSFGQNNLSIEIFTQPQKTSLGAYYVPESFSNPYAGNQDAKFVKSDKSLTLKFSLGGLVSYRLNEKMGVSLGMIYSGQGQNYKYDCSYTDMYYEDYATISKKVSLNYLFIPITFNFIANPEAKASFIFSTGFYKGSLLGYKDETNYHDYLQQIGGNHWDTWYSSTAQGENYIYSKASSFNGGSGSSSSNKVFVKKPYKGDFGFTLGTGFQFKLTDKISMPIMVNYSIGFSNIKRSASQYTSDGSNSDIYWREDFWEYNSDYGHSPNQTKAFHNSAIGLRIGLKINLQSKSNK